MFFQWRQGLVYPEWRLTKPLCFKEEDRWHRMHPLNEMLTEKEAADDEGRTGAYPFLNFRSICIIDGHCNWGFL